MGERDKTRAEKARAECCFLATAPRRYPIPFCLRRAHLARDSSIAVECDGAATRTASGRRGGNDRSAWRCIFGQVESAMIHSGFDFRRPVLPERVVLLQAMFDHMDNSTEEVSIVRPAESHTTRENTAISASFAPRSAGTNHPEERPPMEISNRVPAETNRPWVFAQVHLYCFKRRWTAFLHRLRAQPLGHAVIRSGSVGVVSLAGEGSSTIWPAARRMIRSAMWKYRSSCEMTMMVLPSRFSSGSSSV